MNQVYNPPGSCILQGKDYFPVIKVTRDTISPSPATTSCDRKESGIMLTHY